MKKNKKNRYLAVLTAGLIGSAGMILYPWISNRYYEKNQSFLLTEYSSRAEQLDPEEKDQEMELCRAYNEALFREKLRSGDIFGWKDSASEITESYEERLGGAGGILCYVEIPSLELLLPVYHGDSEEVLQKGLGHIRQTSLPVGGAGTHAAITGHSGMAGKRMFTDLQQMKEGDIFKIHVLGEVLLYETDQILVVLPEDVSALKIEEGRDLVTLITCTPYGINSHRLLVRGSRREEADIAAAEQEETLVQEEKNAGFWEKRYKAVLVKGLFFFSLILLVWMIRMRRGEVRRKNEKN